MQVAGLVVQALPLDSVISPVRGLAMEPAAYIAYSYIGEGFK